MSLRAGGTLGLAAAAASRSAHAPHVHAHDTTLVEGYAPGFVLAAGLMVVAAVVSAVFFGEQGRGRAVNLADLQNAGLG